MSIVDVIVPTLNGSKLLRDCLVHLQKSTLNDYRLIIYDDGSNENIRDVVTEFYPDATLIRSERNRGLAYGFNRCIEVGSSPFVVLLNNDVEVSPEWLHELVACAERHPESGSIASKIRLIDDRTRIHSAGDYYSLRGVAGNRGVWLHDAGQFDAEDEIFGACGAAALYRRSSFEVVRTGRSIFDERLFMYYEDIDLAWRLQLAGLRCVFAPRAVVYHHLSATGGGPLSSYYSARNSLIVLNQTVPRVVRERHRRTILAHHLGRFVHAARHIREPAARATLRGILSGVCTSSRRQTVSTRADTENTERIATLLAQATPQRNHGIPIARLGRPTSATAPTAASDARSGRPASE